MKMKFHKFLIVLGLLIVMTGSGCGWLDKAVTAGIDTGFGNTQPCSGIVCP
jgi:hypothetical protein